MERPRGERDRAEEQQVGGECRVPGEEEGRHGEGQRTRAGIAVKEGVRGGVVDVGLGDGPGRGHQRPALVGEGPHHLEQIEVAAFPGMREGRVHMGGERPGEPDHDGDVERQRQHTATQPAVGDPASSSSMIR